MTRQPTGRSERGERGSIAPLVIGLAAVVAMLVAVVVDVSAAFLRREAMNAVADAAALAATDGLQGDSAYRHGLGDRITLDGSAAGHFVVNYLRATAAPERFPGLSWSVMVEGDQVLVRLRAPMELPLRIPGAGRGVEIAASSAAVVSVSQ